MGRNRLIPEYTFMDPRAVGKWDMLRISSIEDAVWAFDEQQAGKDGRVRVQSNPFKIIHPS